MIDMCKKIKIIFSIFVVFCLFFQIGVVSEELVIDYGEQNPNLKTTSIANWTVMYYMCSEVQN